MRACEYLFSLLKVEELATAAWLFEIGVKHGTHNAYQVYSTNTVHRERTFPNPLQKRPLRMTN